MYLLFLICERVIGSDVIVVTSLCAVTNNNTLLSGEQYSNIYQDQRDTLPLVHVSKRARIPIHPILCPNTKLDNKLYTQSPSLHEENHWSLA